MKPSLWNALSRRGFRSQVRNWEFLGRADPLFGILSNPDKYGDKWDMDEFFASGQDHVYTMRRTLEHLRVTYETGSCLDFGCGVGRLTAPLGETFSRAVGVDVASSMIELARRLHAGTARCEFLINDTGDLRQFEDQSFDFVHSSLVLQHIPRVFTIGYIAEFFRVCKPGGLVVFQVPSGTRVQRSADPLTDAAYAASIAVVVHPPQLAPLERSRLRVEVINEGPAAWRHDISDGRHFSIGNHWRRKNGGSESTLVVHDDGRSPLPRTVEAGDWFETYLMVQAPAEPGEYEVEIDLVQEYVCWFASKGSRTARVAVSVSEQAPSRARTVEKSPETPAQSAPERQITTSGVPWLVSSIDRVRRRLRFGKDPFEMNPIPRAEVEAVIRAGGGQLLRAIDDTAAGPDWASHTYICRRLQD